MRFDDKSTRRTRVQSDEFCMISEIWTRMVNNCQSMYTPSCNLTVDEQLLPSKCRCPFQQYMPQKPDKFGIKFWVLCDCDTKYVLNIFSNLGKNDLRPADISLANHVTCTLMKPFFYCEYNVTADNYFVSFNVALTLLKEKVTIVGTIRINKRELPTDLPKIEKDLHRYESKFLVDGNSKTSLTIYKSKPRKSVCILSTMHLSCQYGTTEKLPETIDFYNDTKHGVNMFDSIARMYTTKAGTRRWPMYIFYNHISVE